MKKLTLLAGAALLLASCGGPAADPKAEVTAKNKEAMQKINEMFMSGNTDGIENYVADNVVEHNPDPMIKSTGIQYLKDAIKTYKAGYPDMKFNILSLVAEGDMAVMHFNMTGTNTGQMGDYPPTNKAVDVNGVDIVRFENGKGVEHWGYWEESKMMTQLGLMPQTDGMPADTSKKMEEKK
jgi:predicted ester cyclase